MALSRDHGRHVLAEQNLGGVEAAGVSPMAIVSLVR